MQDRLFGTPLKVVLRGDEWATVEADFDPSAWHPGWCEPVPCDPDDLVWDEEE